MHVLMHVHVCIQYSRMNPCMNAQYRICMPDRPGGYGTIRRLRRKMHSGSPTPPSPISHLARQLTAESALKLASSRGRHLFVLGIVVGQSDTVINSRSSPEDFSTYASRVACTVHRHYLSASRTEVCLTS